MVLRII